MTELRGDFWTILENGPGPNAYDQPFSAVVCPTNTTTKKGPYGTELVMGAGLAKDFRDRAHFFGISLALDWGRRTEKLHDSHVLATMRRSETPQIPNYLINFPTKTDWKGRSSLYLIQRSSRQLYDLIIPLDLTSILMPRVGCGLGGLKWEHVKPVLEEELKEFSDRIFIVEKNDETN